MGISTDPRQLERLQHLEQVLGLLQNPESYTRLLADVKATIKQQEEVAKRYASVDAAERFLQESRTLLENAKLEDKQIRANLATAKANFESDCAARVKELEEREARVLMQERNVKVGLDGLAKQSAEFQSTRAVAESAMAAREGAVATREQKVAASEMAVRERAGQIAKLAQVS